MDDGDYDESDESDDDVWLIRDRTFSLPFFSFRGPR